MPVGELLARTPGLERPDFKVENHGEQRTDDMRLERLEFLDGPETIAELHDVRAYLAVFENRISEACTSRIRGGALAALPKTIGAIEKRLTANGFVIERSTRGEFLSPSSPEVLRQRHYLRGDHLVVLAVDLEAHTGTFSYDICSMSVRRCRSPALLELQERGRRRLDDLVPLVQPRAEPPRPEP